jgi:hypothetical protein
MYVSREYGQARVAKIFLPLSSSIGDGFFPEKIRKKRERRFVQVGFDEGKFPHLGLFIIRPSIGKSAKPSK